MSRETVTQRHHHVGDDFVVELIDASVVLSTEYEHFVGSARLGHDMNRPEIAHRE